jgi:hypothetical protein
MLGACALLAVVATLTPETGQAIHCNNKVCFPEVEPPGEGCYAQVNGPGDTHCIDPGVTCAWDFCPSPE